MMRWHIPQTWGGRSGSVLAAFLLGVGVHSIDPLHAWRASWIILVLIGCAVLSATALSVGSDRVRFWSCCILALCLGIWRFDLTVPLDTDGLVEHIGQVVTVQGSISSMKAVPFGLTALLDVSRVDEAAMSGPGSRLELVLSRSTRLRPGDGMTVSCHLRALSDDPTKAEQRLWSARQGVWVVCGSQKMITSTYAPWWDPLGLLYDWRQWLDARIDADLPTDEADLLKGVLYGEQDLSTTLQTDFRNAGITHIIAVSGSNVSIVVVMMFGLTLGIGLRRRTAFQLTSAILVAFVFFVGLSASVLRAACMSWLALFGRDGGRLVSGRRLVILAAAALCLYDPWQLCFDAGFALSFLATIGLLEVMPRVRSYLDWVPEAVGLRDSMATTIATTAITAPYSAWVFGQFSLVGLIANAIALPLVPWAMLFGAISAGIGPTPLSFLHWPTRGALDLIIWTSKMSEYLPWLIYHFK